MLDDMMFSVALREVAAALRIAITGSCFAKEILDQIFEPFLAQNRATSAWGCLLSGRSSLRISERSSSLFPEQKQSLFSSAPSRSKENQV